MDAISGTQFDEQAARGDGCNENAKGCLLDVFLGQGRLSRERQQSGRVGLGRRLHVDGWGEWHMRRHWTGALLLLVVGLFLRPAAAIGAPPPGPGGATIVLRGTVITPTGVIDHGYVT